jgi:hypothetical protein
MPYWGPEKGKSMTYLVLHTLAATFLLGFVLCWLGWLWFIICLPVAWARSVSRQHTVMLRYGPLPRLEQGHGLLGDRVVDEGRDGHHHPHGYLGATASLTVSPQAGRKYLLAHLMALSRFFRGEGI